MGAMAIPLVLTGVGAAVNVAGQVRAGRQQQVAGVAQRDAAYSHAELADYNAMVAELQAEDALDRGLDEEQRFRSSVRGMIGSQRAALAANNVDVGYGSALDVQADAAFLAELDVMQIRTNAAREAWGYKVQAEDYRKRGQIIRKEGDYAKLAGGEALVASRIGAAGTLLTTAGSLLMQKYGGR